MIHALGIADRVQQVTVDPWTDETVRDQNPLCKVPVLILKDYAICDSAVICEFLNDAAGGSLIPRTSDPRFKALALQALGDGLAEAVIRRHVEGLGPPTDRSASVIRRQEAAIDACARRLDSETAGWGDEFAIGQIAVGAALVYLEFRSPGVRWRDRSPRLAAWCDRFRARPPVIAAGLPA